MPTRLIDCKIGDIVQIINFDAGCGAIVNLRNHGIDIGNSLKIVRKSPLKGPIIVLYQDSEIAIGYGLAKKIIVKGI